MAFFCDSSYPCEIVCGFAPNAGYSSFEGLGRYCCAGNPDTCADCLLYYLPQIDGRCEIYSPSGSEPPASPGVFVSDAAQGFNDFFPVFLSIFAAWVAVKLISFAK